MATKKWVEDSTMDEPYRRCSIQYKLPKSEVEWVMHKLTWGRERAISSMMDLVRLNGVGNVDAAWYIQVVEGASPVLCYGFPPDIPPQFVKSSKLT